MFMCPPIGLGLGLGLGIALGQDQDQEPPKKKQKRQIKPLPDKLAALTKETAAASLRFREEKDPLVGSLTHNVMVQVAYGVQISENSKEYFFQLEDLNLEQLRRFCSQLGITGNAKNCRFHCRRALYAYFTKDPVDFSLMPFLSKRLTGSPPPRPPSETIPATTSPAVPVDLETTPTVQPVNSPTNNETCVATSVPPSLTETSGTNNTEASNVQGETSLPSTTAGTIDAERDRISTPEGRAWLVRIKECPHPDDAVMDTSGQPTGTTSLLENHDHGLSQQHSDGSGGTSRSGRLHHPVRIKTESPDEDMDPHVHHHHHHHPNESSSNRNNVETVVQTFVSETDTNGSSDAEVDTSSHPALLLLLENNNHDSEPDAAERETIDQPCPSEENNHDSPQEEQIETSSLSSSTPVQDPPFRAETNHEFPEDNIELVDQSSNHPTTNVVEGINPQVPDESSLQSMLMKTSQVILTNFQKSMETLHTIREDDLALKREELALRKQELLWKKKEHLQQAMNQTLQNYMNPACPPEFKVSLLEQWKQMDVEFKALQQEK